MIQCQYYLRVKAYYKVLMGCGTGPTLFLPFYLIPAPDEPVVLNYSPSFVIPEGAESERSESVAEVYDYVPPPVVE